MSTPIEPHECHLTGYYETPPSATEAEKCMEGPPVDYRGCPLYSLQDYIVGHQVGAERVYAPYVSVAMDQDLKLPYGTLVYIPTLDAHYGKRIVFKAVDHGGDFISKGFSKCDIRCKTLLDSTDDFLNRDDGHAIYVMLPPAQN